MPLGAHKAAIMGVAGVSTEELVLLATTAVTSATGSVDFTGISSTYSHYMFGIYNANPATDTARMAFQMDDDGGSNGYNAFNITSSIGRAIHYENNANAFVAVNTAFDASSTAFANLGEGTANDADGHCNSVLHLFNPASTVYAKHFICRALEHSDADGSIDFLVGGYINTTTALNAIRFKFTSGNIDTGTFKMWGAK